MDTIFLGTRWIHIVVGFAGLVAFWIPAFARKGGAVHRRWGRVYEWAAYIVAATAVFNAIGRGGIALGEGASVEANRAAFGFLVLLAYLGVVTFASARHGARTVRLKGDWEKLDTPAHRALAYLAIAGSLLVGGYALFLWSDLSVILLVLSPIGIGIGRDLLKHMRQAPEEKMAWFYRHMENMIGAGVAFHTAFLVFGSSRFIPFELTGVWQVVPWVLPAAIGFPIQRAVQRKYRRRFGEPRVRSPGPSGTDPGGTTFAEGLRVP